MRAHSVAVVFGTRPEVVKLAPVLWALGGTARTIHTGQHYDPALADTLLHELGLAPPMLQLAVGGAPRGAQLGEATMLLDGAFAANPPEVVVVQGDTNTTLAGALAANARNIPLVHVEAGLRSYDRAMPEEHNRVVTDHLADLCCAPTETSRERLAAEGIAGVPGDRHGEHRRGRGRSTCCPTTASALSGWPSSISSRAASCSRRSIGPRTSTTTPRWG